MIAALLVFMPEERSLGICVPVAKPTAEAMELSARSACDVADSLEFRLDYLERLSVEELLAVARRLADSAGKPAVLTLRPVDQGGRSQLCEEDRRRFWSSLDVGAYFDIEADLLVDDNWARRSGLDLKKVICSYHNFESTPDLRLLYDRFRTSGAACYKFATRAGNISDVLEIKKTIHCLKEDGCAVIAVAMGMAGVVTRILGLSWGNFLTYASAGKDSSTAPGQLTARELRETFRAGRLSSSTAIYGIAGKPVGQSLSPVIHNGVFSGTGQDAVYLPFEVEDVEVFVRDFVRPAVRKLQWNLRGLSVTIPHKVAFIDAADEIDDDAKAAGAANTIVVEGQKLRASNTDLAALRGLLESKNVISGKASVLGAGGAARAAVVALRMCGCDVTVFARQPEKTDVSVLGATVKPWNDAASARCDILVNATPLGMDGSDLENVITDRVVKNARLVIDFVYGSRETSLISRARMAGVDCLDGVELLSAQAARQQMIWTGCLPDLFELERIARSALERAE